MSDKNLLETYQKQKADVENKNEVIKNFIQERIKQCETTLKILNTEYNKIGD